MLKRKLGSTGELVGTGNSRLSRAPHGLGREMDLKDGIMTTCNISAHSSLCLTSHIIQHLNDFLTLFLLNEQVIVVESTDRI